MDTYIVPLKKVVEEFKLEVLFEASDFSKVQLTVQDVSRPGLQLTGYLDHFEPMRLQIVGNVEMSYMNKLSAEQQAETFDRLFSYKIPALVIARNMEPAPVCLEMAKRHNVTVLRTPEATSTIIS